MTQAKVVIVPLQGPVRRRRLDLALALAMLNKAVSVHERTVGVSIFGCTLLGDILLPAGGADPGVMLKLATEIFLIDCVVLKGAV